MLLSTPKGITSVSLDGREYKVKKRQVEVPDEVGLLLIDHGLTPVVVDDDEEPEETEPETPPAPPDPAQPDSETAGDGNGK